MSEATESSKGAAPEGGPLATPIGWSRLLLLWVLVTLPMVALTWVVVPWLVVRRLAPAALVFFFVSSGGVLLQAAVARVLLRREAAAWTWRGLRQRLWLDAPRHPATGRPSRTAWLWLVPFVGVAVVSLLLTHANVAATMLHRFLREPSTSRFFPGHAKAFGLMSPELAGQWWLLIAVPVVGLLTTVAGEELLFRGVLLPRMRGRGGWAANAVLFALHFVYVPWMVPARLLAILGPAWAARRYRSNWIPLVARLSEVAGITAATGVGVMAFSFPAITGPIEGPRVAPGKPMPAVTVEPLAALPAWDERNFTFSVDLRGRDVSALDLRERRGDLDRAVFDSHTLWPPASRLPEGFDPARILTARANPGLGLRALHARGITGRRVGIGIIDAPLLPGHREYARQLRWNEVLGSAGPEPGTMHGSAMASIAVGRTTGVAPEADLYFVGVLFENPRGLFLMPHLFAQAIRRLVEINRALPEDRKIRAISLSQGWGDAGIGSEDAEAAVALARREGIAFFSVTHECAYGGVACPPGGDPDSFADYEPAWMWRDDRFGDLTRARLFSIPIDHHTVASETAPDALSHFAIGGHSMGPPFVAAVYALAAQADPGITPERFLRLGMRRAWRRPGATQADRIRSIILDPGGLIDAVTGERARVP